MAWAGFRDIETPRTDNSGKLLAFLGLKEAGKGGVALRPEGTGFVVEGLLRRSQNHSAEAGREWGRNTLTSPSTPALQSPSSVSSGPNHPKSEHR